MIRELCGGADVVRDCRMGGGTGTGRRWWPPSRCGALSVGVAILPFDGRRLSKAKLGLEELKGAADAVVCLQSEGKQAHR